MSPPTACPSCGGVIVVDRVDVSIGSYRSFRPGRWRCANDCPGPGPDTDELVRWIGAVLDRRELWAQLAAGVNDAGPRWRVLYGCCEVAHLAEAGGAVILDENDGVHGDRLRHMATHDPADALAEVAATRQLVALHAPVQMTAGNGCANCGQHRWCQTLRLIASRHAAEPGYEERWKP